MPFIDLPSHRLHYRIEGAEGKPWLTFCNSLGTDLHMWGPQVEALASDYRILRYDRRGHGESSAPPPPYSIEALAGDVVALWDALEIEQSHFCGLSIGGLTGQWLGLYESSRVAKLVVCATSAKIGSAESWQQRIEQVHTGGLEALADATVQRWFTPAFASAHPGVIEGIVRSFVASSDVGYAGCCAAVAGADFRDALGAIETPLLAIAGDDDPVCPPADLRRIAEGVSNGRYAEVPGRHICNMESAAAFNTVLTGFLQA